MEQKPGSRWKSVVCDTAIAIVRAAKAPVTLECGGQAMISHDSARPAGGVVAAAHSGGSLLGKRYADTASGLEVLCTKAGAGSLSVDGRVLVAKEAKRLPSSD